MSLTPDEEIVIFTIWWLRRDLNHAYFPELEQLTSKTMDSFTLGKTLRRLQDKGYIDSSNGYTFWPAGQDAAWRLVQKAQEYGQLPPRLRYAD